MPNYESPMAMFQNVNPVPNNPFWSGMMGARNQMAAQPFMEMDQQSQGLDLQKKTMETGEFMSPQAQDVRQRQRAAEGGKADFDVKSYAEQIRGLAPEMDARIAKAKSITMQTQGQPAAALISDMGQMYDVIQKTPEEQRPGVWAGAVQRWQMTHPGMQVPDQFRNYSPEHLADVAAIRYTQLNMPEQVGKERLKGMEIEGGMARETQQQEGATARAGITADAHIQGARLAAERAQAQETPQRAIARLRRTLSANPKNAEAEDEYKSYLDDSWQKEKANDMTHAMLQIRATNSQDPKAQEAATKQMNDMRYKFYADRGIFLNAPADGTERSFEGKKYRFRRWVR
jgi:hypothetical protein